MTTTTSEGAAHAAPSTGIIEKVFLRGTITALTGLRVGGTDQGLAVGDISIAIRHALLNEPYIPGSSLRGKMRSSLERLQGVFGHGHGEMFSFGPCDDPRLTTVQLFGTEAANLNPGAAEQAEPGQGDSKAVTNKGAVTIPSRLLVRDALLARESREQLRPLRGDLRMTETKTEVCIDRVTSAANPRTFERVPAGAVFAFEMVLEVRALPAAKGTDDPRDRVLAVLNKARDKSNGWGRDDDLRWLLIALDLLQDDALGGQGSRGYGRVKVDLRPLWVRTRKDYLDGLEGSEIQLEPALQARFDALNKRGEKERDQILASLPGAAP